MNKHKQIRVTTKCGKQQRIILNAQTEATTETKTQHNKPNQTYNHKQKQSQQHTPIGKNKEKQT